MIVDTEKLWFKGPYSEEEVVKLASCNTNNNLTALAFLKVDLHFLGLQEKSRRIHGKRLTRVLRGLEIAGPLRWIQGVKFILEMGLEGM